MKLSGEHSIAAPRQDVWDALQDPAVLARTLPGCTQLQVAGPDRYRATINAGVASVKGIYQGEVRLADIQAPDAYTLHASGAGAPGTVRAEAKVRLEEGAGATTIRYDADAVVGGMIGGVGQRMLASVAKRTAGEFFGAIEHELLHGPVQPPAVAAGDGAAAGVAGDGAAARAGEPAAKPATGQVFAGAPQAPVVHATQRRVELAVAMVVGAAIALVGVWLGRRWSR